jgi:hypothetical protein
MYMGSTYVVHMSWGPCTLLLILVPAVPIFSIDWVRGWMYIHTYLHTYIQ